MIVSENVSIQPYNSFNIDAIARYFGRFANLDELQELLERSAKDKHLPLLILGGGSNILFTKDFNGWVLRNEYKKISLINEDADYYYVQANAGENWHGFVQYCVQKQYAGVENLSLIPGNVGASPIQNIGAYGVEVKDVFQQLEAWDMEEKCIRKFELTDCEFGYRESVFKKRYRNRFVILHVVFRLRKQPVFHTEYGAISQQLEQMQVQDLSIGAIAEAVIRIRSSKLPDPKLIGNAGSFFKNPVIPADRFIQLKTVFPAIPGYPSGEGQMKIAAGWLIEQCGWKGFRKGDAGCYDKQALVLVNYGKAKGDEIFALSESIIGSVTEKFGITLEREVNMV